jgi:hypothetical protein
MNKFVNSVKKLKPVMEDPHYYSESFSAYRITLISTYQRRTRRQKGMKLRYAVYIDDDGKQGSYIYKNTNE